MSAEPAPEPVKEVVAPPQTPWQRAKQLATQHWPHLSWLVPLLMYLPLLSFEHTIGDGPEMLIAMYNLGAAHPSGYPLMTMLGYIISHLPVGTPYLNVSFVLSAIPSALTAFFIFQILRELRVSGPVGLLTCWAYAFSERVMYQSTRIEVYALHNLFLALAFFAILRHTRHPQERKWYYFAVLAVCLGLTNHLTSVFMVPVVVLAALMINARGFFTPKSIAISFGIGIGCGLTYLYLPWQAFAQYEALETISWNDTRSFKMFWRHVTGEEYNSLRKMVEPLTGLDKITTDLRHRLFPGIVLIGVLGIIELARMNWRLLLCTLVFFASHVVYVSGYTINDIATYYPAAFLPFFLWIGLGANWLIHARIPKNHWATRALQVAVFMGCLAGIGVMYWLNRGVAYHEQYGEDMGDQAMSVIQEPAIVITEVDRHTFTMWYQAYVKHPERKVIPLSRGLWAASDRLWYREFLRRRHPEVDWPTEEETTKGKWVTRLIRENPDFKFYAFPWTRWTDTLTMNRVLGWVHELIPKKGNNNNPNHRDVRYIHMSEHTRIRGDHVFWNSEPDYTRGRELACVVSWYNDHKDVTGSWIFYGPNGEKIAYPQHNVPPESTVSWEYLPLKDQRPGKWRCEVKFPDMEVLTTEFELR